MSDSFVKIENLARRHPAPKEGAPLVVFERVNFSMSKGEFVCIIGHSGCGKSTVLSMVAGLSDPDPAAGQAGAKKCQACHDLTEASTNKTGPGLYDVVERVMGNHPGFAYSDAMMTHHAAGDTWTYENLDHFLTSPKTFMPGTKMTFAGLPKPEDRANVIAYLESLGG